LGRRARKGPDSEKGSHDLVPVGDENTNQPNQQHGEADGEVCSILLMLRIAAPTQMTRSHMHASVHTSTHTIVLTIVTWLHMTMSIGSDSKFLTVWSMMVL